MNRTAIVLDGLMLLYLAAATVVGVQSSAADGHALLASVLGVLLALCVLALIAARSMSRWSCSWRNPSGICGWRRGCIVRCWRSWWR